MSQSKDDLASRILERAQMAQMTRQLKLGLSQIPRTSSDLSQTKRGGDDELLQSETSPQKKTALGSAARKLTSPRKAEPATIQRPARTNGQMTLVPSSPKAGSAADSPLRAMPSTPGRSTNTSNRFLTTPNRKLHGKKGENASDNNAGADLLMYLATSPYTKSSGATQVPPQGSSANQQRLNHLMKIPTTPSSSSYANHQTSGHDDAIRLSSMKPTLSSPQSTFKVPQLVSNAHSGPSLSYHDVLMESPSLYLNSVQQSTSAISPQKRKVTPSHGQSVMSTSIPTTPSREVASTVQHITGTSASASNSLGVPQATNNPPSQGLNMSLLKTPNFNMGDYIHNLFSPSPNVPAQQGSIATSMLGSMRKTSVSSGTGSTSSGNGNNAFDGLLAATTSSTKQQQPISTTASASSLLEKASGDL